jgi:putative drug exporter of the RND superfamily
VDSDVDTAAVRAALARLRERMGAIGAFGPSSVRVEPERNIALVSAPVEGDPTRNRAREAIETLRNDAIPQAFAGADAEVLVTGRTAEEVDYSGVIGFWMPIVFAFVLAVTFLLLTVVFRSIVVAAKAMVLNLLSVGAAYGLLVLVFQHGVGAGLLGFQQVDAVEAWVPLFLFSVLFGLSMDYHVFILSRIREGYLATGDTEDAVAHGVASTARLITGAALIIIAVFVGFATGELVMFQQMGFGVAVALAIDATLVRSVLLPAAMKLLGARNWYLPRWLEWLPRLGVERPVAEAAS